jgi:hypothetical protein
MLDPEKIPPSPGPKFRPVFVLKVDRDLATGEIFVEAAYATGQRTSDKINPRPLRDWQMEFDADEGGLRLTEQTRVDFSKVFRLPYREGWFASNGKPFNFGRIPTNRKDKAQRAKAAGIAHIAARSAKFERQRR